VIAERHDPPRQGHGFPTLEIVLGRLPEARLEISRPVGHGESAAERLDPAGAPRLELLEAATDELVGVGGKAAGLGGSRHDLRNLEENE
jgi:hypothetical protein